MECELDYVYGKRWSVGLNIRVTSDKNLVFVGTFNSKQRLALPINNFVC